MRYLQVKDDVYFIDERLKEIDENYIILYNLEKNAYEVHLKGGGKESYCFTVPYGELDGRTIFYAQQTASSRRDKIIQEIEENNQKLYEKSIKDQVKKIKEALCL